LNQTWSPEAIDVPLKSDEIEHSDGASRFGLPLPADTGEDSAKKSNAIVGRPSL
jgi:hypothetical protein